MQKIQELIKIINPSQTKVNEPLSRHTVVAIGGPADIWYESKTSEDFINVIKNARKLEVPVTVLGRGSNTLISDRGIRGLVIRNTSKEIKIGDEEPFKETVSLKKEIKEVVSRWDSVTTENGGRTMYDFKDLDYDESNLPLIEVKIDSGVDMPFAMNFLLNKGITGLQWYSRIPGNLGGWIYNNVHGGTHFIKEVIKSVQVLDEKSNVVTFKASDLHFGYDESRFHKRNEIIVAATLELYKGDKFKAQYVAIEWAKRKSIQPSKSTGCIFANISNEAKEKFGYPTGSIGYIIEHIFNLSNFRIGDAAISLSHHNFIENKGKATASDYLEVIREIQKRAKTKFGFIFKPEIFFLGFNKEELQDIIPLC